MTPPAFPDSYRAGRAAFLTAAENRGLSTITRVHPAATGRDGKPLFLDTASIGRRDAEKALLLIVGTHGVEGYFGSAALTALLQMNAFSPPPEAKIVLVHALNPYGFAWDRRGDENNVDVNRNFVDFIHPPENPAYDAMADRLLLRTLSAEDETAADDAFMADVRRLGAGQMKDGLMLGQYRHPDGFMYGGAKPSWSRAMLEDILREELGKTKRLLAVDLHTGLGSFGAGERICEEALNSIGYRRAKAVWGDVAAAGGDCVSPQNHGTVCAALTAARPGSVAVTLEIGTVSLTEAYAVLRRDNWLYRQEISDHPATAQVAAQMRAAFCPEMPQWRAAAWAQAEKTVKLALAALA